MLSDEEFEDLARGKEGHIDFGRAVEAEARKQDEALIRQMFDALKNCRATGALDDQAHDLASAAINAARARLG